MTRRNPVKQEGARVYHIDGKPEHLGTVMWTTRTGKAMVEWDHLTNQWGNKAMFLNKIDNLRIAE